MPAKEPSLVASKVAFLAWHAWRDVSLGDWPPAFPEEAKHTYTLAEELGVNLLYAVLL